MIEVVRTASGLSFPDFEAGSGLGGLGDKIAAALATTARKPCGSALELLIRFEGYPEDFCLWWDGFTCELGQAGPTRIDLLAIAEQLSKSGLFMLT